MENSWPQKLAAGIDLGGTKIGLGVVDSDEPSKVRSYVSISTPKDSPHEGLLLIENSLKAMLNDKIKLLAGIGIGVPGPVDPRDPSIAYLPNLPSWNGLPLAKMLSSKLDLPVMIENDANVAALGEKIYGAGKGIQDFIFVTLGTGVGGALVLGDRLYRGSTGLAGEIGHTQIDPSGPLCGCGKSGCLEMFSSGTAIEKCAGMPSPEVFSRVQSGDRNAMDVLARAGMYLGRGLSPIVTALDPQAVIIGGGLASGETKAFEIYLVSVKEELNKKCLSRFRSPVPVIKAILGNKGPVLGACHLVLQSQRL